jgi:hypothetical protein
MAGHPRKLTEDERRALQLLAFSPHGATEDALVLAHGFDRDMLTGLLDAKLVKRYRVTVTAPGRMTGVTVIYLKILAAGRKAVERH